jgi:hypothetical protein
MELHIETALLEKAVEKFNLQENKHSMLATDSKITLRYMSSQKTCYSVTKYTFSPYPQ